MIQNVRRLFLNENPPHAVRSTLFRTSTRIARRLNGKVLGWGGASVPLGSRILGSRHIHVGLGFTVAGRVWIEAVVRHAGADFAPTIRIGRDFRGSGNMHLTAIDSIEIGDDCLFGSNVFVADHGHGAYKGLLAEQSHPSQKPNERRLSSSGPVSIGDRCWLGDNVVVLQNVTIGAGSIVGANSVVTKDIPAQSIAAGSPAVVIRTFSETKDTWLPRADL